MLLGEETLMQILVNVIYDEEYRGYVVDVPELPGCMSQGKTVEQALKNAKEAISLYLETTPKKKRLKPFKHALTTTVEV
jgi:predicted RNase H-like HicB family nuclease